jgi:ABC-type sugar transport system substrate-binding protein
MQSGSGYSGEEQKYIIGMSQANLYEPWRIAMNDEIKREETNSKEIEVIYKDAAGRSDKQKKDIEDLVNSGIDLLIVSITDSKALTPLISEVYKKIPVIILDRAVEGYDYTLFIGPDNEAIGKEAGQLVAAILGSKGGKVVEVQGLLDSPPTIDRSSGFRESIKLYKNISISRTIIGEWQRDEVEDKIYELLKTENDIDVIFAHSDYMALGVYRALQRSNRTDIKIVGVDGLKGENGGIGMVQKGILYGTFKCPTGGKEALKFALEILKESSSIPKKVILRSEKITIENVSSFIQEIHE